LLGLSAGTSSGVHYALVVLLISDRAVAEELCQKCVLACSRVSKESMARQAAATLAGSCVDALTKEVLTAWHQLRKELANEGELERLLEEENPGDKPPSCETGPAAAGKVTSSLPHTSTGALSASVATTVPENTTTSVSCSIDDMDEDSLELALERIMDDGLDDDIEMKHSEGTDATSSPETASTVPESTVATVTDASVLSGTAGTVPRGTEETLPGTAETVRDSATTPEATATAVPPPYPAKACAAPGKGAGCGACGAA